MVGEVGKVGYILWWSYRVFFPFVFMFMFFKATSTIIDQSRPKTVMATYVHLFWKKYHARPYTLECVKKKLFAGPNFSLIGVIIRFGGNMLEKKC